jgi:acetyl-CoA carboxylase alpha subunit
MMKNSQSLSLLCPEGHAAIMLHDEITTSLTLLVMTA